MRFCMYFALYVYKNEYQAIFDFRGSLSGIHSAIYLSGASFNIGIPRVVEVL